MHGGLGRRRVFRRLKNLKVQAKLAEEEQEKEQARKEQEAILASSRKDEENAARVIEILKEQEVLRKQASSFSNVPHVCFDHMAVAKEEFKAEGALVRSIRPRRRSRTAARRWTRRRRTYFNRWQRPS